MPQRSTETPSISYPAFLWRENYIYLAATPLELCSHPRSLFEDTVQRARAGEYHLLDAEGRAFDVADWIRIRRFGGLNGIAHWLLRSVFATPVLTNEVRLSLPEYKKKIACAIRGRYRHDTDKLPGIDVIGRLKAAESYRTTLGVLSKL